MNRCSFCEWTPILPLPVWPLAGQCRLGQNVVVGSMTLLLAVRGHSATRSMSGPPFALQLHRTTVWCGATDASARQHIDTLWAQEAEDRLDGFERGEIATIPAQDVFDALRK